MFGLFGTGILVIFVNLLSLCMKILNKILSTHARQAVLSYFVVLGKASARRGRKWWFTTTSSGSISWLFNSCSIHPCCTRDCKHDVDPTTANGINSSIGAWRYSPALSSSYALTGHCCHTLSNDDTLSAAKKCHQSVVFYIFFVIVPGTCPSQHYQQGKRSTKTKESSKRSWIQGWSRWFS